MIESFFAFWRILAFSVVTYVSIFMVVLAKTKLAVICDRPRSFSGNSRQETKEVKLAAERPIRCLPKDIHTLARFCNSRLCTSNQLSAKNCNSWIANAMSSLPSLHFVILTDLYSQTISKSSPSNRIAKIAIRFGIFVQLTLKFNRRKNSIEINLRRNCIKSLPTLGHDKKWKYLK